MVQNNLNSAARNIKYIFRDFHTSAGGDACETLPALTSVPTSSRSEIPSRKRATFIEKTIHSVKIDGLTEFDARRFFDDELSKEIARATDYNTRYLFFSLTPPTLRK